MKFTIQKFILSIIPHRLVRVVKKKINISYLLFGPAKKNVGTYHINEENFEFRLYGMEQQLGPEVVNGFKACYDEYLSHPHHLRKYLLEINDCIIEPVSGWGITKADNKLVFDSISNNTWRETYHPGYFEYKVNKNKAETISEAISINLLKGGDNNYWHFLHDLLGQVIIARENIKRNIPFLISLSLAGKSFFQQALQQSPELAKLTWIIRDKWYHVKKAWFVQTMPNDNYQFFKLRELLDIPDSDASKQRKIFLTRSQKRIRFIKNKEEIEDIAKRHGFEIVDTDGLSLQEQIRLFGETRWLIGIHGAGLTNVLYRKNAPMALLELLPGDYLQPHYFWLSKGMGHQYDCLVGTVAAVDTSFRIDPEKFEARLVSLVGS